MEEIPPVLLFSKLVEPIPENAGQYRISEFGRQLFPNIPSSKSNEEQVHSLGNLAIQLCVCGYVNPESEKCLKELGVIKLLDIENIAPRLTKILINAMEEIGRAKDAKMLERAKNKDDLYAQILSKAAWVGFMQKGGFATTFAGFRGDLPEVVGQGPTAHSIYTGGMIKSLPSDWFNIRHRVEAKEDYRTSEDLQQIAQTINKIHLHILKELAADPAYGNETIIVLEGSKPTPVTLAALVQRNDFNNVTVIQTPYQEERGYFCEEEDGKIEFFFASPSKKLIEAIAKKFKENGVRIENLTGQSEWKGRSGK